MVRSKCAEQGEIELIIFDSIEMFTQPMNTKPLRQQLNEVYAALKELALQMNVPVLVTSGLKPQLELRKNKRPMLTDFPHPEITERWADLVLALYSDAHYVPHSLDTGIIEINSIYNRNGPMGVMNFAFLREYCLVDDLLTTS